jgi:hypothetical protein
MEDYKMKSNRNAQIIDEEISKLDIEDSAKAQLFIQLNTAHCLRSIKEELVELNSILRHKSGIDQPDGWDSSKNQKDTDDVPETVTNDLGDLRNDLDDLSQQLDDLRGDVEYKSNEDHDHDIYLTGIDLEDLEDKIYESFRKEISNVKKDFSEPKNVTIKWRDKDDE